MKFTFYVYVDLNTPNLFIMKINTLPLITPIIVLALSACQTATSKYAGEGEIFLSTSSANHAENYLKNPNGEAFALSTDGYRTGWVSCAHHRCAYQAGSAEAYAINLCEKSNRTCKILFLGQQIVWKGPVRVSRRIDNSVPVSLVRPKGSGTINYSGKAILSEDQKTGTMSFKNCKGDFDIDKEHWHLACKNMQHEGKLSVGKDSLYWGKSTKTGWELSIERKRKTRLEEAILKHNQSELVLSTPQKPIRKTSDNEVIPDGEHPAVMTWANIWGKFKGTIFHKEKAPKGRLEFSNLETGLRCKGAFEVFMGIQGNWSLDCSSNKSASGSIKVRPGKIFGEGMSKDGEKISFRLL